MKILGISTKAIFLFMLVLSISSLNSTAHAENGSIAGTVYEEETGLPLSGALVYAVAKFGNIWSSVSDRSENDGTYRIENLAPGPYYIVGQLDGYGATVKSQLQVGDGHEVRGQDLQMTNNPGRIYGIIDCDLGPLEGVYVCARLVVPTDDEIGLDGTEYQFNIDDRTDSSGYFELRNLGPASTYVISVSGVTNNEIDYASTRIFSINVAKGEGTAVDLELVQAAKIYGQVKDSAENPIKDVLLSCWVNNNNAIDGPGDTTDENGEYELKYLAPGFEYVIEAHPSADTDYIGKRSSLDISVAGEYFSDIILEEGAIVISGSIVGGDTLIPLQNVEVYYYSNSGIWRAAYTDENGNYNISNIPAGSGKVIARPAYTYAWKVVEQNFSGDTTVDFALASESTVSGVVKDFNTGEPVLNMDVSVYNEAGIWKETVTAGLDGSFVLRGLPEGIAEIFTEPDFNSGYARSKRYIYLAEGEHKTGLELFAKRGAEVSGTLKDALDAAISDQSISVNGAGGEEDYGRTDASGDFRVRLSAAGTVANPAPCEYNIGFNPGSQELVTVPQTVFIVDQADEKSVELIGYDASSASYIRGQLIGLDAYSGNEQGLHFGMVVLPSGYVLNRNNIQCAPLVKLAMFGEAGPYELMVPPDHNYDLYLLSSAGAPAGYVGSYTAIDRYYNIPAGSVNQDLYFRWYDGAITGKVTNEDQPLLMAKIYLSDINGNFTGFADTDQTGIYNLCNIPEGDYIISAWHQDHGYSIESTVNVSSEEVHRDISFSNDPPVIEIGLPIGDREIDEGQFLQFEVRAEDINGDPIELKAENLPPGSTFEVAHIHILQEGISEKVGRFRWTPTYEQSGTYPNVTFIATDDKDAQGAEAITITVNDIKQADLTVHDIYDDNGKLSIEIGNIGIEEAPSGEGHLFIWIDDVLVWTYGLATLADQSFRNPGGKTVVCPQVLSGRHKIKATIDPFNRIYETDEENNNLEKTVIFGNRSPRMLYLRRRWNKWFIWRGVDPENGIRINYSYKIDSGRWSRPRRRRRIRIKSVSRGLRPGRHTFYVKAIDRNGAESNIKSIRFSVRGRRRFWQWWRRYRWYFRRR